MIKLFINIAFLIFCGNCSKKFKLMALIYRLNLNLTRKNGIKFEAKSRAGKTRL